MRKIFIYCLIFISILNPFIISISSVDVTTVEELHKALSKAKAGQVISIEPGIYDFSKYQSASKFYATTDGTCSSTS